MKSSSWALWSGAGGSLGISRAAAAFWIVGGAMLGVWLGGLLHEAVVWGVSPLLLAAGLAVACGWCWLAWSTWRAWRADRPPLTLLWTGPVRELPQEEAKGGPVHVGGFRVVQWDAPVRVDVLLDWQRWMLLRVQTTRRASRPRESWLWLGTDVRHAAGVRGASLHQLRSLLYLSPRLTVLPAGMPPHEGGPVRRLRLAVASWLYSSKTGSTLRPTASPRPRQHPASSAPRGGLPSSLESRFPSTLIMRDEDGLESHARSGRGDA